MPGLLGQSKYLVFGALAAMFLMPVSASAQQSAQNKPNFETVAKYGDWGLICNTQSQTESECALAQAISVKDTGDFLAEMGVNRLTTENGKRTVMIARVPGGADLTQNPAFKIDEGQEIQMRWQVCANNSCRAIALLDEEQTKAMKAGKQMRFGVLPFGAQQPLVVEFSLSGITAGINALDKK